MAVRLALGARPSAVLGLVLRDGVSLAAIGCGVGVVASLIAGRAIERFLYRVSAWDVTTLGVVVLVVVAAATAASVLPGRRAALEDPARALHAD